VLWHIVSCVVLLFYFYSNGGFVSIIHRKYLIYLCPFLIHKLFVSWEKSSHMTHNTHGGWVVQIL